MAFNSSIETGSIRPDTNVMHFQSQRYPDECFNGPQQSSFGQLVGTSYAALTAGCSNPSAIHLTIAIARQAGERVVGVLADIPFRCPEWVPCFRMQLPTSTDRTTATCFAAVRRVRDLADADPSHFRHSDACLQQGNEGENAGEKVSSRMFLCNAKGKKEDETPRSPICRRRRRWGYENCNACDGDKFRRLRWGEPGMFLLIPCIRR